MRIVQVFVLLGIAIASPLVPFRAGAVHTRTFRCQLRTWAGGSDCYSHAQLQAAEREMPVPPLTPPRALIRQVVGLSLSEEDVFFGPPNQRSGDPKIIGRIAYLFGRMPSRLPKSCPCAGGPPHPRWLEVYEGIGHSQLGAAITMEQGCGFDCLTVGLPWHNLELSIDTNNLLVARDSVMVALLKEAVDVPLAPSEADAVLGRQQVLGLAQSVLGAPLAGRQMTLQYGLLDPAG